MPISRRAGRCRHSQATAYAATASVGFLPDLVRKVEKAKAMRGFNRTDRSRSIADYLALQRRCRHLDATAIAQLQTEVDDGWTRLMLRVGTAEATTSGS